MLHPSTASKSVTLGIAALLAVAFLPTQAAAADDDPCSVSDVDYAVNGSLQIKDTQFGAADGNYPLGSGKARVRFEHGRDGTTTTRLMSYDLDSRFTVKASFALWNTTVVTASHTKIDKSCEGASTGVLNGGDVVWSTPIDDYHSDGTIACEGNVCGKFGAPALGSTPLHESQKVLFRPFHFGPDGKTFTMVGAKVSHSDSPKQTTYLSLSGREVSRACVATPHSC
jgi:hypothetical protein